MLKIGDSTVVAEELPQHNVDSLSDSNKKIIELKFVDTLYYNGEITLIETSGNPKNRPLMYIRYNFIGIKFSIITDSIGFRFLVKDDDEIFRLHNCNPAHLRYAIDIDTINDYISTTFGG